jgi:DNA-binding beta-propeller fold protein YncE
MGGSKDSSSSVADIGSQLKTPSGIAIDSSSGNVYVADYQFNNIQKFTSNGIFVTKWGSIGVNDGEFKSPDSIAIDTFSSSSYGDIVYVTDWQNNRIQKFTSDGKFITKWGSFGSGDGQFNHPRGIAIDRSSNYMYVVDQRNSRVQQFALLTSAQPDPNTNMTNTTAAVVSAATPDQMENKNTTQVSLPVDNGSNSNIDSNITNSDQILNNTNYIIITNQIRVAIPFVGVLQKRPSFHIILELPSTVVASIINLIVNQNL